MFGLAELEETHKNYLMMKCMPKHQERSPTPLLKIVSHKKILAFSRITKNSKDRFRFTEKGTRTRRMTGHSRGQQNVIITTKESNQKYKQPFAPIARGWVSKHQYKLNIHRFPYLFRVFRTLNCHFDSKIVWLVTVNIIDGVCDRLDFSPSRLIS